MKPRVRASLICLIAILAWIEMSEGSKASSQSQLLQSARTAYRNNQLKSAVEIYATIDPLSQLWPEALEEKAWAHARLGEFETALNHVKTLTDEPVVMHTTLEPFVLGAMIRMKTCQYDEMYRLINKYKKAAKARLDQLTEARTQSAAAVLWELRKSGLTDLDKKVVYQFTQLPRHFNRDRIARVAKSQKAYVTRAIQLARIEAESIHRVTRRLSLVEAEAASRVLMQKPSQPQLSSQPKERNAGTDSDVLRFPDDPNEVWIDEVGLSQHLFEGCPVSSPTSDKTIVLRGNEASRKKKGSSDL